MPKTKILILWSGIFALLSCTENYQSRTIKSVRLQSFAIDSTSIRAIKIINDSTVYYAGSAGAYGSISGSTIVQNRITDTINNPQAAYPHFRSIAFNGQSVFVLTVGNPALLFELGNEKPALCYREDHPGVFYDSMAFFDTENGIAFGDPTEDCPSVIVSRNGGNSWSKIPCDSLPEIHQGEAAFAASNTNIAIVNNKAWLVTGGKKARVFHSPDKGKSWEVYNTPIVQGSPTTGIYSVAFHDENNGVIFGGDYTRKTDNNANNAVTADGGKTWTLVANNKPPGYISCVQYVPGTQGTGLFAVSTEGIYFSNDKGYNWAKVSNEGYYSIRFSNKNTAWLSGNNKIARMTF